MRPNLDAPRSKCRKPRQWRAYAKNAPYMVDYGAKWSIVAVLGVTNEACEV